jgi:hypothetical protein
LISPKRASSKAKTFNGLSWPAPSRSTLPAKFF